MDEALSACAEHRTALTYIGELILKSPSRSESDLQNSADAATTAALPTLTRRLHYLPMLANVATLIGLLGTIFGLIRSFGAIAMADPAQRQAILAAGISEAMTATAFGLFCAIFTMISHSVLTAKATRILEEIDEFGVKLLDLLSARKYRHSTEKGME